MFYLLASRYINKYVYMYIDTYIDRTCTSISFHIVLNKLQETVMCIHITNTNSLMPPINCSCWDLSKTWHHSLSLSFKR